MHLFISIALKKRTQPNNRDKKNEVEMLSLQIEL